MNSPGASGDLVQNLSSTLFFQTCLGVLQGGGCRAPALVGAYRAATKRGVNFAEVAGTSAGAILAALVGAGATPEQLEDTLSRLDFPSLLDKPKLQSRAILLAFLTFPLRFTPLSPFRDLWLFGGLHSSSRLGEWVEAELRRLLPQAPTPITFSSLKIPTHIVATDLRTHQVKVWSQRKTPNDEVAFAVRASCSIPLFFQPLDNRYVDGGALSNLPSFVFLDADESDRPLASRVLAFSLLTDEGTSEDESTLETMKAIVSAVVDGSRSLQLGLQRSVHVISIPTGRIKATDFETMDRGITKQLLDQGEAAANRFLNEELTRVRAEKASSHICHGREETYTTLVQNLGRTVTEVWIAEVGTRWVYDLFPALLIWRSDGVRVRALLGESGLEPAVEAYRRRLLRALGVEVVEKKDLQVRAYVINPLDSDGAVAIVRCEEGQGSQQIDAVVYSGSLDYPVIRALSERLTGDASWSQQGPVSMPRLQQGGEEQLKARLGSVSQYAKKGVEISIEDVAIERLLTMSTRVREYKYGQAGWLLRMYENLVPFEPALVVYGDGKSSVATPPVVEATGDNTFVLIEGSTRALVLMKQGQVKMRCVVVRGVQDPLPSNADPVPIGQARVVGRHIGPRMDLDTKLIRNIEIKVHAVTDLL